MAEDKKARAIAAAALGETTRLSSSIADKLPKRYTAAEDGKALIIGGADHEAQPMTLPQGTVVIDPTLTLEGQAADAFATGEGIRENKSAVDTILEKEKSTNLVDKSTAIKGYLGQSCVLNTGTGNLTDYIEVEPSTEYIGNKHGTAGAWVSWCFADKTLDSHISTIESFSFTTPENCHYVRLEYLTENDLNEAMLVKGTVLPPQYIPYVAPHYVFNDNAKTQINDAVESEIGKYIDMRDNNFFDKTFGRCSVNATNHEITQMPAGPMVGSGFFRILPNMLYKTIVWAQGFSFFYDSEMQYVCDMYDTDRVHFDAQTAGDDTGMVFTVLDDSICYACLTAQATVVDVDATEIKIYNESANAAHFDADYSKAYKTAFGINTRSMLGKKWAVLGDSITFGFGLTNPAFTRYSTLVQKECGVVAYNYGYSGSRIAVQGDPGTPNYDNAMVVRYANMIEDADYITVLGGINDANNMLPMGEMGSTDIYTFYGALDALIVGLLNKYPGKSIGFITYPHYGVSENHESYIEAVKKVCYKYAIPVLDLYSEGQMSTITQDISEMYYSDGLHPNILGHTVIARKVANFLNRL